MLNFTKSNFVLKLFVFCLVMPLSAGCQTVVSPKSAKNKNQTISDSNQKKTNQSKNEETETSSKPSSSGIVITKSDVAQTGERVEDFSPKGWYLMMNAAGDLNGDNLDDAVAVFSKAKLFDGTDESTHSSAQSEEDVNTERVLIVALRDADGSLRLDELSQKIILCRTCGGWYDETLSELSIKNKVIEISQDILDTYNSDYLHKIKKDARRGWVVFYGEGKFRERRTGKETAAKQKGTILLSDFNIMKEVQKLSQSEHLPKKANHRRK